MNVHHKCQKKVANLCGVNQKLMAEALAVIEIKQQVGGEHGEPRRRISLVCVFMGLLDFFTGEKRQRE